jgi:hypothetical protein
MSSKLNDVNFPNLSMLDVENPERLMELVIECEEHLLKKIDFVHRKVGFCVIPKLLLQEQKYSQKMLLFV